jgi:uncharacterized protein YciI
MEVSMPNRLFVVILRYLVPLEMLDAARAEHLAFLDLHYASQTFLASGRQSPPTGGIILAQVPSRAALEEILKDDPFQQQRLAEYQIFEWLPNKCAPGLESLLAR